MITVIKNCNLNDIVSSIKHFLHMSAYSPEVRGLAVEITANSNEPVISIYDWVKQNILYIPDPVRIEQFTSPVRLVKDYREGKIIGEDCDSHAMLVTALCESIGILAHVILIDQEGQGYNHAYSEVWSDVMNWINVDTTSCYPLGWIYQYYNKLTI